MSCNCNRVDAGVLFASRRMFVDDVLLILLLISYSHFRSTFLSLTLALLIDGRCLLIFQQQQQPTSQPPPPLDLREVTDANATAIYTGWSCLDTLPVADIDLINTVREELSVALPSVKVWPTGSADLPAEDVIRVVTARPDLPPDLESIRSAILSLEYQGDTEDATHSAIDLLVLKPIKLLCRRYRCAIATNRNGVDASGATLRRLRPDVLLWLPSGVLAFKGEDKAFGVNIQEARDDLREKMSHFTDTFFGTIPYQLAYACSGQKLEFRAFVRTKHSPIPREIKLTDTVDLGTMAGRSLCVRYAVNVARILEVMHRTHPSEGVVQLGQTIKSLSSRIIVLGDFVRKNTRVFTDAEVIRELYKKLTTSGRVPHLIFPTDTPKIQRGELTVNLSPVGYCKARPGSVDECKEAGRQLLEAVSWLHANNFVHRDIRDSNVMRSGGQWCLIDLEWSNYAGLKRGEYDPTLCPPECDGHDCTWNSSADMWQFGKLLEDWKRLDEDGRSLVRVLTARNPANRLSAEQTLAEPFFAPQNKE